MGATHIDDPFRPFDATIVRPRPGAGRRGAAPATQTREVQTPQTAMPAHPTTGSPVTSAALEPAAESMGLGLNPLVRAAMPLLLLMGRLRQARSVADVPGLRGHVLAEVRRFEERAHAAGIALEGALAARYALCAALDEAALTTPWGAQSEWAQATLLVTLHREAWGGEKFFEMLKRISRDPARHIDLMELQYVCLALGFSGKYQLEEGGGARLSGIQQDLHHRIRAVRDTPLPDLSTRWRGAADTRNPIIRYVPWWVVAAAAAALVCVTFTVLLTRLGALAAPVQAALAHVGTETFAEPAATRSGPRLKVLLAAEEARGVLRVDEDGGRSVVTLEASDLFPSGSAQPAAKYSETIDRVAAALNEVNGRILVVGHTDDQPLASLRYRDNFELSRERALAVVRRLQLLVRDTGRITWSGAGPSEPRYRPATDPANRARNRRVEIIHTSGS